MNIQDFDLNLLLALEALLRERHVTRAAMRIGLSQPAMSNALARLRDLLDDPLLVRTPRGMVPTPRAERLQEPLREALRAIERSLSDAEAFEPGTAEATVNLMTSDAIGLLLLPEFSERLRDRAPGINLRVHSLADDVPWESLEQGRMDLLLGVYDATPAGIHDVPLYEERFVCLVREGHPLVGDRITLRQYVTLPHVLISTTRSGLGASLVDRTLEQRGLSRRVGLSLPNFLLAPYVVAAGDQVLTFPSRLAARFAQDLPLRIVEPPLAIPGYTIRLYWHERVHREPACAWLREQVRAVANSLDGPVSERGAREPAVANMAGGRQGARGDTG